MTVEDGIDCWVEQIINNATFGLGEIRAGQLLLLLQQPDRIAFMEQVIRQIDAIISE